MPLAAFELSLIKGPASEDEEVHLEHCRQMNQVETLTPADSIPYSFGIDVEFAFDRSNERIDLLQFKSMTRSTSAVIRATPWIARQKSHRSDSEYREPQAYRLLLK